MLTTASRAATATARRLVKSAPPRPPQLLVPPGVLLHQRSRAAAAVPGESTSTPAGDQRTPAVTAAPRRRSRPLRRLRLACTAVAGSLPAAALRRALCAGAQQLASGAAFASLSSVALGGLALSAAHKGLRRWHAGRRLSRKRLVTASMGPATEVSVVTFNIRGIMDRWPERAPLLRQVLKQADADVCCFQEVLTGEFGQELRLLGADYSVHECRAALSHLRASGLAGAAYAAFVDLLLQFSWTRSLLVSLPEAVEGWRERNQLSSSWSRLLRDLAIAPFYGNSIASRLPAVLPDGHSSNGSSGTDGCSKGGGGSGCCGLGAGSAGPLSAGGSSSGCDLLVLGDFRAAQRVCVQLRLSPPPQQQQEQQQSKQQPPLGSDLAAAGNGSSAAGSVCVWLVNTHLDHATPEIRARQMQAICNWMEPLKPGCAGIIVTGDLNAPPSEELHAIMRRAGYASAHEVVHGSEPARTWPSGIRAPLMDQGDPHCADYVYAWQAGSYQLTVAAAALCGDAAAEADDTLYPSDHLGIHVKLRVAARAPP